MLIHFPSWLVLAVIMAGIGLFPLRLAAATDLNKEFIESFYRVQTNETDARLKIQSKGGQPEAKVGPTAGVDASNASATVEGNDPSWVGKFLQLLILFLLGLIIYLLSRRSRSRDHY